MDLYRRTLIGIIAALGIFTVAVILLTRPADGQVPPSECESALVWASQTEAAMNKNSTDGIARRVNLENDLRNFVADVRAACPPPTTTTAPPTTTTAPPTTTTTTTAPPTTTTVPQGGLNFLADPSAHGYPDADNTGPSGSLAPVDVGCGDYVVDTPGAVVENLDIRGSIAIYADNVTIRNVRVRTTCNWIVVWTASGVDGLLVEDSEFDGGSEAGTGLPGVSNSTFRRNDIHHVENGFDSAGSNVIIEDNYIHDLTGPPTAHFDGIQTWGGQSNFTVRHNTISIPEDTGTVFIANNSGPFNGALIEDNLLAGGTYTIYVDNQFGPGDISNIRIRNNRFGWHTFGYVLERTNGDISEWSGNVDDATGQAI